MFCDAFVRFTVSFRHLSVLVEVPGSMSHRQVFPDQSLQNAEAVRLSVGESASGEETGPERPVMQCRTWKRALYLACGGTFFILGTLGAILPGLPTTPFLLLTSYFLVRSSPRLNAALLRSRFFGPILIDWQIHGGVRPDIKVKSICVVTACTAVSVLGFGYSLWLKGLVLSLAGIGVLVIIRLPEARMRSVLWRTKNRSL